MKYLICLFLFFGCGALNEDDLILNDKSFSKSVEVAISSLSGAADDHENESYAFNKSMYENIESILNPISKAYAISCSGRAGNSSCTNGVKSKSYLSCTIEGTYQELEGSVSLTYSDNNCSLNSLNDEVVRTYDYTRELVTGAIVQTTSEIRQDYEGNSVGGGAKLVKVANGYSLTINGKHKIRKRATGEKVLDISIRTTSPITFTSLDRASRIISGGALVLANNMSEYKITLSPENLQFTGDCCYPTSGSLNLEYSGGVSGSGNVTFTSCGQATVSKDADSFDISFDSCE